MKRGGRRGKWKRCHTTTPSTMEPAQIGCVKAVALAPGTCNPFLPCVSGTHYSIAPNSIELTKGSGRITLTHDETIRLESRSRTQHGCKGDTERELPACMKYHAPPWKIGPIVLGDKRSGRQNRSIRMITSAGLKPTISFGTNDRSEIHYRC